MCAHLHKRGFCHGVTTNTHLKERRRQIFWNSTLEGVNMFRSDSLKFFLGCVHLIFWNNNEAMLLHPVPSLDPRNQEPKDWLLSCSGTNTVFHHYGAYNALIPPSNLAASFLWYVNSICLAELAGTRAVRLSHLYDTIWMFAGID